MTIHTDITWTDAGWEQFKKTEQRHANIRAYYGDPLADEHEAEFLRALLRVTLAAGPVNIQPDGDGFFITTPHIVIGLVWTPDTDEKMAGRLTEALDRFGPGMIDEMNIDHWPRTGHWSAHS